MRIAQRSVLDDFQRKLDRIEKIAPMADNYQRIDPYIVEKEQAGIRFDFVIYHRESELWYGQDNTEGVFTYFNRSSFVRSNEIIWDIGCNSGFYSIWFALAAPNGHVYSFDPYPWNAAATETQANLNGCKNVTAYPFGLAANDRSIVVHRGSSNIKGGMNKADPNAIRIQVRDPKRYIYSYPTFLKIDVEGAEHELANSSLLDIPSAERGYIEMHPQDIVPEDPRLFLERLISKGFSVRRERPDGPTLSTPLPDILPIGYCFDREVPEQRRMRLSLKRKINSLVRRVTPKPSI